LPLESLPAIVLLVQLIFPIAAQRGIHPMHDETVAAVAMNSGRFAPPVGIGFRIAGSTGKVEPDAATRTLCFSLGALPIGLLAIIHAWMSIGIL